MFDVPISVVIPVYNVEQYLPQCIESVLGQTLENLEIICVEDGSSDASLEILQAYSKQNRHIQLVQQCHNSGLASARNVGIEQARGDYLFFLDSDDFLATEHSLELLYEIALQTEADEVIGGMTVWDESTGHNDVGYHRGYLIEELRNVQYVNYPYLFKNVVSCNKLTDRQLLNRNGVRFDPELAKFEDNPFSCKVHVLAKRISLTTQTTYVHRIRKESSNPSLTQSYFNDHIWHIKAGIANLQFLRQQDVCRDIMFLHEQRLFSWLAMDIRQANQVSESDGLMSQIFNAYTPVLSSIDEDRVAEMGKNHVLLLEALHGGSFALAEQLILTKRAI